MWPVRGSAKPERNFCCRFLSEATKMGGLVYSSKGVRTAGSWVVLAPAHNLVTVMTAISFCLLRARALPERGVEKEGLLFNDVLEF